MTAKSGAVSSRRFSRRRPLQELRHLLLCLLFTTSAEAAEFRLLVGHGGPVMDAEVSEDGRTALTGSFDNAVGFWSLGSDDVVWLDGHRAAVKSVTFVDNRLAASGGDDFAITLWNLESGTESARLEGHKGQVAGLAVSPDRTILASASWDGSVGLWSLPEGQNIAMMTGHGGVVNDVAFSADGTLLYSASADGTIRVWRVSEATETRQLVNHGFGVNRLLMGEVWLAYGAVDGGTRVIDADTGDEIADLTLDRRPILAMALRPDAGEIAVGDGEGFVMTVSTESWTITGDFQAAARGPVWTLAYSGDGESLLAGGIDDTAYIWPAHNDLEAPIMATKERGFLKAPEEMSNGERQFRRKCSICHSLTDDGARRAGPHLGSLFGRPAGSVSGYKYSDTVAGLGFQWDEDTIDQLFDLGPDHFIPGSKMPMQRIVKPADRADLIAFLKGNT